MSEWWTYRLEDFLLFSPRVYWRMFELQNAQFWPLPVLTLASGLVILIMASRRMRGSAPTAVATLAVLWFLVAWAFLWNRYASINWAMSYVAPVFGLEALLLAAAVTRSLCFDRQDKTAWAGWLIAGLGVVVYPLLAPVFGRPWAEAEVFGVAPDPTAIATLGMLLLARGRFVPLLMPIPLAWLLISGLTLRTMGDMQGWIPLLTAVVASAVMALRPGRAPPATQARSDRRRR